MKKTLARTVVAGLLGCCAMAQEPDDRTLIDRAAAERSQENAPAPSAVGAPDESAGLGAQERDARIDVALSQAKLELVLARKALKRDDDKQAAQRAVRALSLLREVPGPIDTSVWELQAEGILAKAEKEGIDVAALREAGDAGQAPRLSDPLDRQAKAAAEVAGSYTGVAHRDVRANASEQALRQYTLERQTPDDCEGYRPGREVVDFEAAQERDRQRTYYQGSLEDAYKADEARRLVEVDEARIAPETDISFPPDWPQRVAKRRQYAGGAIYRSPGWKDGDGRDWYAAIYDIRDITYVAPDFQPPFSLTVEEDLRNALDRQALRDRSEIFGGYAEDLAAGIPLLRFFGGIDDYELRGPKYSPQRQQQVIDMIKGIHRQPTEAQVIPLGP